MGSRVITGKELDEFNEEYWRTRYEITKTFSGVGTHLEKEVQGEYCHLHVYWKWIDRPPRIEICAVEYISGDGNTFYEEEVQVPHWRDYEDEMEMMYDVRMRGEEEVARVVYCLMNNLDLHTPQEIIHDHMIDNGEI